MNNIDVRAPSDRGDLRRERGLAEYGQLTRQRAQIAEDAALARRLAGGATQDSRQQETRLPQAPQPSQWATRGQPQYPAAPNPNNDLMAQALINMHLPKPELLTFDGSAKKWTAFRNSFVTGIANRVQDPALRLSYLIQHCTGEAKKSIQDCVLLNPEVGYDEAMSILTKRFGSNHLIARSYIEKLTQGPKIGANDVDALVRFTTDLRNAKIVLTQLEFTSDMNSHETMRLLVKRLPYTLGSKWVEKAADILESGREPRFSDLVRFMEVRARVSSTMYGRDHANQSKNTSNSSDKSKETNQGRNRNRRGKGSGDKQSSMGSWAQGAACGAEDFDEPAEAEVKASQSANNGGKKSNGRYRGRGRKSDKKDDRQAAAQDSSGGGRPPRRIVRTASPTLTR